MLDSVINWDRLKRPQADDHSQPFASSVITAQRAAPAAAAATAGMGQSTIEYYVVREGAGQGGGDYTPTRW